MIYGFEKNVAIYGPLIVHHQSQVNRSQLPSGLDSNFERENRHLVNYIRIRWWISTSSDFNPL